MSSATIAIAVESFKLLRRDRIFVPAAFVGAGVAAVAQLASGWSIEDFSKILVDVGGFGFTLAGSAVAMLWGVKTVTDAREGGALEVQLAAPVGRVQWLVGKYLGLAVCLGLFAGLLLAIWQALMLINAFGRVTPAQLAMFAAMLAGWLVTGALAMLFASFTGMGVALFATACAWLAGQASALVLVTLSPDTPAATRAVVGGLARYWDLQQMNLIAAAAADQLPDIKDLILRGAYAAGLVLTLVTVAAMVFSRRDLSS